MCDCICIIVLIHIIIFMNTGSKYIYFISSALVGGRDRDRGRDWPQILN